MRRVKISVWLIVGTLAVSASLAALPSLRLSSVPTETPARVQVVHVTIGDVRQTVHARGQVRYEQEYAVIAPVTGIAEAVYVEPGDRVTAGQALIRLDDAAQAAAVSSAYAAMAQIPEQTAIDTPERLAASHAVSMEALTLRAPADGQVLDVPVGQYGGLMAGSGAVLMAGGQQQVVCAVSARDARTLEKGMRAEISADGAPICGGLVGRIGLPMTDSLTGQTVCEVLLTPDEAIDLPYGSTVEADITLREKLNAATVPVTAVTEDETVWVVSDGRCWEIPVTVLLADEISCWMTLPEGTAVVDHPEGLIEGQRVKEAAP